MKKFIQHLLSPNAWVGVFSILAIVGISMSAIGLVAQVRQLTVIGLWLIAPLLIGGIVILLVVFPILIVNNRRQRK